MNRVYLRCNECGNVFSGRASPYGYKCVLCHSVNVTVITKRTYMENKNLLKKTNGLKKIKFHCKECGYNFRAVSSAGKTPIYCPRCNSNRVSKGWIQKEEEKSSGVNAKLKMFEEVIA